MSLPPWKTHEVENQTPALENINRFDDDVLLQNTLSHFELSVFKDNLSELGKLTGESEKIHLGHLANQNLPRLETHDRQGNRIDFVEFHPSYHKLFSQTCKFGIHSSPWSSPKVGAHVSRAVMHFMTYQVEQGHICPTTMTYGCVPALKKSKTISEKWLPKIYSNSYDPSFRPVEKKSGALIGMSMTEKQGGSDVRTNTTTAESIAGTADEFLISGHKWFCSAPMSDAFLVLAQTTVGPTCFLVPRWKPDGSLNNFFIQRLKNKLGDRSNASSEIELQQAWGQQLGDEGRGIPLIIEMANYTRLDCAIASASLMRWSSAEAIHHASHRHAFGAKLIDQPMMQKVLADLALEAEASMHMAFRLAHSYDQQNDEYETSYRRIVTAIAKYWNTKRSVTHVYEGMEVLAGNGFVEESHFPRFFRQAPVNSIWEGSGNVMCLDVLRALQKDPRMQEVLFTEFNELLGRNASLDKLLNELQKAFKNPQDLLPNARWFVEKLAVAIQAGLMLKHSSSEKAELFCAHRLNSFGVNTFGALTGSYDFKSIALGAKISV